MAFDAARHEAGLYAGARRFAFTAATERAARRWRDAFRPTLREALGLARMDRELAGHRVRARRLERTDLGDHTLEKWHVWTEPDVPLPVWVLWAGPDPSGRPLVLTPHGHNHPPVYAGISRTPEEAELIRGGERDIALQAAREGYLAILPTARGFGDTRSRKDRRENKLSSCRDLLVHDLLVGRTPIGDRVWDVSRLIDWALDRWAVDPRRIAVTGNSGGGTTSLFAAACETRIAVAVPSCYFCTFAGSIGTIRHCECNYVPGVLRLGEMWEVAGLVAPRPFQAISGRKDEIFPIVHARRAYAGLRRIYRAFGAADRCGHFVGAGGHRYYRDGSWPWIRRWFASL